MTRDLPEKVTRATEMARLYDSGMTLQQVGDEYGIGRERVRQLLDYIGYKRRIYTRKHSQVDANFD